MNSVKLKDMVGGWFVGAFSPTALNTQACEVAVKKYQVGAREKAHYHAIATEVTLILSGQVRMCGQEWGDGDIVVLAAGDVTDFEALTDVVSVVVKVPGVLNDKYLVSEQ
jgi:quercetin dioxygenase-like cupin family protein